MSQKPNLQTYVEYICVNSIYVQGYVRGKKYYFPEDEDPGPEFKMVVDLNDFPVTITVRL